MDKTYQKEYAAGRPQMYDTVSRKQKAKRIIRTLRAELSSKIEDCNVLDVGASTGIIDYELAKVFKSVTGIDIDKGAIKNASEQYKRKNLRFKTNDAMNLTFPDNSFDIVICTHVYEHVPNAKKLFNEIHRVLKPGGTCYLAAINRLWPIEPHYNLLFLSWLPKPLANMYLNLTLGKNEYYESPKSYFGLKNLTNKFKRSEITQRILRQPEKYGYDDAINNLPIKIGAFLLSPTFKFLSPTFFWLLEK